MENFEKVINKLKIVIRGATNRRVTDKEVAEKIGISSQNFSNLKKIGNLPIEYIMDFGAKRKISINWLFYSQVHSSLENEIDKFIGIQYY